MQLVVERGFEATSTEAVLARADVGSAEFERRFSDLRDCCMQIYIANMDDFNAVVFGAASGAGAWQDRLRAAAYTAARYIQARPIQTRFDMIQMLGVGDLAQAYRDRILGRIVDLIDEGRQELEDPESMSREVAVAIFGSIYQSLLKDVRGRAEPAPVESFVPQLMYIAVRPYLGHDVACEELLLPAPPSEEEIGG
jgi:AcrR family transcriptional regulator